MNDLAKLKTDLEEVLFLAETQHHQDFSEALRDCIYAGSLGETALKQHLKMWEDTTWNDIEYQQGVQFVAEQWDRILSEDNKGEGL